jgi:hypothetical protein
MSTGTQHSWTTNRVVVRSVAVVIVLMLNSTVRGLIDLGRHGRSPLVLSQDDRPTDTTDHPTDRTTDHHE